ncbi:hypothetical protein TRFO_03712 [Tritrichomonas foetus]|uniref:Uncharacterized protein n=1 Tax=Tritrichomonas foetus TaxID=1144522 RepID=A0A1J4KLJ7_9EUKA|nr:hypothetical protein TRFO_03712 [Tritrichomonas foetus]|eukprot:OHT12091.1 hypothetical protein TRFO_03712 [Tritrichomonas foetus]
MSIRNQPHPFGMPAPRPKPKIYKYVSDDNPDINKIVFDIIDGLKIEEVEPDLFANLLPCLQQRSRALMEWRNQPASRSLNEAIEYILNYRYSNDPKQLKPKTERALTARSGKISQNEININIDNAMRGKYDRINPRLYRILNRELIKIRDESLSVKDYQTAEMAAEAARKVLTLSNENRFDEISTRKLEETEKTLLEREDSFVETQETWEKRIKDALQQKESDLKNIEKGNEEIVKEFDKQFDEPPPKSIFKYSPNILQLRSIESYMVKSGRYSEASALNEEATRLELIEDEQHKKDWYDHLQKKRAHLEKELHERYKIHDQNATTAIATLKKTAEKEIDQQQKSINRLNCHVDDAETLCSFMNHSFRSRRNRSPKSARSGSSKLPPLNSPAQQFRKKAIINSIVYTKTAKIEQ